MRRGGSYLLVATDLASRGVDLPDTTHIYNFDLPKTAVDYLHRAGRTGRKPFCDHKCIVTSIITSEERCKRKCNTIEEFAPPRKILESTTTTIRGPFSFSSLPGKVDQRKVASFSPGRMAAYVVVGVFTRISFWSKVPLLLKA
ncbi:hypothetical protein U1Q18_031198 [Sarracenia purpurea var. burkii]